MRILDDNNNEIQEKDIDLESGYLTTDRLLVAHHDAVPEIKEVSHREIIYTSAKGNHEYKRVIDVPHQRAKEAWDEYEDILRYKLNSNREPAQRTRMDIIEAQSLYTALMTDTLLEEEA